MFWKFPNIDHDNMFYKNHKLYHGVGEEYFSYTFHIYIFLTFRISDYGISVSGFICHLFEHIVCKSNPHPCI